MYVNIDNKHKQCTLTFCVDVSVIPFTYLSAVHLLKKLALAKYCLVRYEPDSRNRRYFLIFGDGYKIIG